MRVVHVSPTYFAPESVLGGGERFAEELARAMSRHVEARFVSFGPRSSRERLTPTYERVILKSWTPRSRAPSSPALFRELQGADAIHCHQYYVLPTFLASWYGHGHGSRVFVTDLGGGGWTPGYHIDQSRWITGQLPLSEYAARGLPGRPRPHRVIYGGVDVEKWRMREGVGHDGGLVFVGRLLPHKGLHDAIDGLPPNVTFHILGNAPNADYLGVLRARAAGKDVRFSLSPADSEIVDRLQRSMALVHLTPVDANGSAGASELFGLALVEAMACGCPVIASAAASLPEIVVDGTTGLLLPPNRPEALAPAVARLAGDAARWREMSRASRRRVEELFTWDAVARRCLEAYAA